MNTASNMIAKWYQYAIQPPRPGIWRRMFAIPTASETAPPVLPWSVSSPTMRVNSLSCAGWIPSAWTTFGTPLMRK